jgi:hypothetical protein
LGCSTPATGSTVWSFDPAANFSTLVPSVT